MSHDLVSHDLVSHDLMSDDLVSDDLVTGPPFTYTKAFIHGSVNYISHNVPVGTLFHRPLYYQDESLLVKNENFFLVHLTVMEYKVEGHVNC